ncbi:outer membrane cobalamin receptor [Pedobacter cryoconitis]|uniref:TonB-dependent receptor n=1 Tax=Pedobacter cryoconitis TaxID=188932 RepID=UPI00160AC11B|nr:TonB-dependent receptor [Pedobacter cryoconitis]MBB6271991.1 outer membrane cobalamin receptor [Pedobacter cryoconitis]
MTKRKFAFNGICDSFFGFSAIVWLGVFVPFSSLAQTDSVKKADELKEVSIRAVKLGKRQLSASPLQILSGKDLERIGSLSVADAIRFFSGVQLKDYGGIGGLKTINVRSMGTNHTAVFYDGVQLGNAQNGQVDLGKFSLDNIEEIELYNGQKSTIFQSARGFASGSSIYLNTKRPEFENGQTDHLKASVKGGSFGLINPSVLWQHKISDAVSASFSTEYKNANGRYKFRYTNGVYDTTLVRKNADIETMRVEAGLNGKLPDSSTWTAKVYFYKDNQGLPGAIVNNVYDFSQRLWNENFFAQAAYKKEAGRYNLIVATKFANDYSRYLNPDYVKEDGLLNNIYKQREFYLSVANRYKINSFWDVVLSGDYQRNTLDANLERFPYPTRNTLLTALATQIHFEKIDIQANLLNTYVNDKVEKYFSAGNKHMLSPTVMVSWQPFDQKEFRIRSFYKNIFRMPTFNDLYYTQIGNTFLKPEYTKQYDLGVTYIKAFEGKLLQQVSVQTDAYYNTVKDKIVAVPGANLFRWSMQNIGRVQIKGLDVNVQTAWKVTDNLLLNTGLTYTYQQALNVTNVNLNYRDQIPYIPLNSGSFLLGADWRNFAMNYSYIYTSERYDQSANNHNNYVPAWYTHDIAFHYTKTINKERFRLSAEVNNLLNQYYDVITNFPMPGRSYRFTLAYSY